MHISIDYNKFQRFSADMERLRDCLASEYGCDMNYSDTGELIFKIVANADSSGDYTNLVSALCDVMSEWRNLVDG